MSAAVVWPLAPVPTRAVRDEQLLRMSLLVVDPSRPAGPAAVEAGVARLPLPGGPATLWTATDAQTLRAHLTV